jgi:hypothetical protein
MKAGYLFLEKALVYGPWFAAGICAVFLAAFLGKIREKIKAALFYAAFALLFLLAAAMFVYLRGPGERVYGFFINKTDAALLTAALGLMLMTFKPAGALFVPLLFSGAALNAVFLSGSTTAVFSGFFLADLALAAAICLKSGGGQAPSGLVEKKTIYFMTACVFFFLLTVSGNGRTAALAASGTLAFMMLMANAAFLTMQPAGGDADRVIHGNIPVVFISGIIAAVAAAKVIILNRENISMYPLAAAAAVMTGLNIYRSITEENYAAYAARDSANTAFLTPALLCGTTAGFGSLVLPLLLAMLSAVLQQDFLSLHEPQKYTVARVKYGFDRVKGGGLALCGLLSGLAAELWIMALFYLKVKQDPAMLAIIMFLCMIYAVAALNKVFIIFSMLSRLKAAGGLKPESYKLAIRPALFGALAAVLAAGVLK